MKNNNAKTIGLITDCLLKEINLIKFNSPVKYIYSPLNYARKGYDQYIQKFAAGKKEIVMIGINPGPWGMVQTGIPFGEVSSVKNWMKINEVLDKSPILHPMRPIKGLKCKRREISGSRLWSWAKENFKTPELFFKKFIVLNYCPLAFIENNARNRTPDKLPIKEKKPLFQACDRALKQTIEIFNPKIVIAIGIFVEKRIKFALKDLDISVGRITHPSPANPKANKGWSNIIKEELISIGVKIN